MKLWLSNDLIVNRSQIILTLLSTGEVYLVDLRRETRGRVEITEPQDESDEEGSEQVSRARCVYNFL